MVEQSELKKRRAVAKARITRLRSKLSRLRGEGDEASVKQVLDEMGKAFQTFEIAFDEYMAKEDSQVEIEASDDYFIEVEEEYSVALRGAHKWLKSFHEVKEEDSSLLLDKSVSVHHGDQSILTPEVIEVLNLPKVELCSFDGDPLQYHPFMTAFGEMVDATSASDSAKLTRLVKATTGAAKRAIQSCLIIGGKVGYEKAKKTLLERFGSDIVVSQAIIGSLRDGLPVRTSGEL